MTTPCKGYLPEASLEVAFLMVANYLERNPELIRCENIDRLLVELRECVFGPEEIVDAKSTESREQ